MDVLSKILGFLPLIGPVVSAIEQIHKDTVNGATKKQIALEALGLAGGAAGQVLPEFGPEITAASSLASGMIDGWVNFYNAVGFEHPATPVIVPIVQAATDNVVGK